MGAAGVGAGAGMQFASGLWGAYAAEQTASENAKIDRYNAAVMDMEATHAINNGEWQASQVGLRAKQVTGDQRAAMAAQGIDVNSGSAADIQESTAQVSEADIRQARLNAIQEAWGYRAKATSYRMQAKAAKRAGDMQAVGSILGGGGQAAATAAPLFA